MTRARLRDLGITIGTYPTGPYNAITDVEGLRVGHVTLIADQPKVIRTGLTVILPRDGAIGKDYAFAGFHRYNGCGEMTGIHWVEETGMLSSAIGLTNTVQVGMVRDAMSEISWSDPQFGPFFLPVVAETLDDRLNDLTAHPLTRQHVLDAMLAARGGAVPEGNVGGGTGMTCHDFKGGIGTSSRRVQVFGNTYTLGALVQTNYGECSQLRVDGVPVGLEIGLDLVPSPDEQPPISSSIIIIIATDAPLLSDQCRRLAQRAANGLARVGGSGHNTSGDLFLAFATGHHIPTHPDGPVPLGVMLPNQAMNPFFDAVVEMVEEAILNALTAAETMTGAGGRTAYALPLDELQRIMKKYHRLS
jgi:D-aminopeptidase